VGVHVDDGYNAPMQIGQWGQRGISWQTLGGRFLAAAARPRTAKIINTVAVVLLAGTLAHWTWGVFAPPRRVGARRATTARIVTPPLSVLLDTHLFGHSTATSLAAIPLSHLALTLSGVVLGDRPLALIGQAGQHVRPYPVGATVSSGVVLAAVTNDRAILRQNGQLESLLLYPPKASGGPILAGPAVGTSDFAVHARPGPAAPVTISVTAVTMASLSQVPTAQLKSSLAPGPEGGLLVKSVPNQSFAALGLQAGDVIEEINGRPVNSLGAAMSAYMAGAKTGDVTVSVARHGHMEVFRYALQGR